MINCTFPWTGMLIDPMGYITLCCHISGNKRIFNKHISKIDSLVDFFNGKEYNDIRQEFKEKTWRNIPECRGCRRCYDDGRYVSVIQSQQFEPSLNKLQFLEFTTSNVCNQSCVTCSSKFSNQWVKINHLFDRNWNEDWVNQTYILSNNDINKIIECLPTLKKLMIKGGEPFADIRNYKVIKNLFKVNNECKVHIVTNGSLIPEKYMDIMFKNPKRFLIFSSIDAIDKTYEWIRGTSWEKTDDTLRELYEQTGIKSRLVPTLSAYNMNTTTELIDWARNAEYINDESELPINRWYKNDITWPEWAAPRKVFTQEQIDSIDDLPYPLISDFSKEAYEEYIKYTKVMNKIRGFNIN